MIKLLQCSMRSGISQMSVRSISTGIRRSLVASKMSSRTAVGSVLPRKHKRRRTLQRRKVRYMCRTRFLSALMIQGDRYEGFFPTSRRDTDHIQQIGSFNPLTEDDWTEMVRQSS